MILIRQFIPILTSDLFDFAERKFQEKSVVRADEA